MEISQKYDLTMIEDLAIASGLEIREYFFDSRKYFADTVFQLKT